MAKSIFCGIKSEIFHNALMRALKNDTVDVSKEMQGLENEFGMLTLRDIMHEMIRQQVLNIISEKFMTTYRGTYNIDKRYDNWRNLVELDMCNDLWKWIDCSCPFAVEDIDFGCCDTKWNII